MEEGDLRHELEATLHARQEVGRDLEPQLVERFVDKIDAEIDRRVDERLAQRKPGGHGPVPLALPLGSLGISIPLTAIAGRQHSLAGMLIVWIAIVAINVAYAIRR